MHSITNPFSQDKGALDTDKENLMVKLAREAASRRQSLVDPDEQLGLDRLATLINTVRQFRDQTWREFALSARPRPFNQYYLMLMSLGLTRRREITNDVFDALSQLLGVREATLRGMFWVEEVVRPQGFLDRLRPQVMRISAPLDIFRTPRAYAAATLGDAAEDSPRFNTGESELKSKEFECKVSYRQTQEDGLIVNVEAPEGRKVPDNLALSVVSAGGGPSKAGPFRLDRGRVVFGHIDWDPHDKLMIERG